MLHTSPIQRFHCFLHPAPIIRFFDSGTFCGICQIKGKGTFLVHYYRPQTKLWKGNVFTHVCQSFCSQGVVSAPVHVGIHTQPPGRHPPGIHTPLVRLPLGRRPPQQTATAVDGMHPTGMLSCLHVLFLAGSCGIWWKLLVTIK